MSMVRDRPSCQNLKFTMRYMTILPTTSSNSRQSDNASGIIG